MARFSSFMEYFALGSYSFVNPDTTNLDSLEVELLKFALVSEHSKPNTPGRKRSKTDKMVELTKEFVAQANDNETIKNRGVSP